AELKDFYKNQIEIWKKLNRKLDVSYKDNRSQLEQNAAAKDSLKQLEVIRSASSPYKMIREIDSHINIVDQANEQILTERRQQATAAVDKKIEQLKNELEKTKADGDTKHNVLLPFQNAKKAIETEESIQKISYQQNEKIEENFYEALEKIEAAKPKDDTQTAKPKRQTKIVKPAEIYTKAYIESETDADEFVKNLRDRLQELLDENAKIRIK
ncbi:MAG: hypothetical protein ACR2J3_01560, partial [Aridibacter sp.]